MGTSNELRQDIERRLYEVRQCEAISHAFLRADALRLPAALTVPATFHGAAERLTERASEGGRPVSQDHVLAWPLGQGCCLVALLVQDRLPAHDRAVVEVLAEELSTLLALAVAQGDLGTSEAFAAASAEDVHTFLPHALTALPSGGLLIYDRELCYRIVAGPELERLGFSPAAMVGRAAPEVLEPETFASLEPGYRGALDGEERCLEVSFRGDAFLVRFAPVRGPDGAVVGGIGTFQNITPVVRKRRRLEQAERLIRASARLTGGVAWAVQDGSDAIAWTPRLLEVFGWDPGLEPPDRPEFLHRVHSDDEPHLLLALERARAGEEVEVRFRFRSSDDRFRPILTRMALEPDPTEAPAQLVGVSWPLERGQPPDPDRSGRSEALETRVAELEAQVLVAQDRARAAEDRARAAENQVDGST